MKKIIIIYIYNIIFNKVKSFIERNQQKRFEIQDNFAKKNKDSELRHDQNVIEVTKENEKLAKESEEKEFQKYIAFYFLKKGQRISLSRKKKEAQTKLQEKAEKLEELDKQNEERRKQLFKRMQKMDKKREEIIKSKGERILEDKMRREEKVKNVQNKLTEMDKEDFEAGREILLYQIDMMNRSLMTQKNSKKRMNTNENTISNQIAIQKNLTSFNKKLNALKSQSVTKKTKEEKLKIFKELKRQEAERRRKEKEDEMYNKGQ